MVKEIVKKCPVCDSDMVISELKCPNCDITIKGEFNIAEHNSEGIKSELSPSELQFVKDFLKHEGNLSLLQKEYDMSYGQIKNKLNEINIKIGNKEKENMDQIEKIETSNSDLPSEIIKRKLNAEHGEAYCPMLKNGSQKIWLTKDGVVPSGFQNLVCEWRIFDAIVEKAKELGGKMYRGDGAAQRGEKIGSDDFPIDTIDAFIGLKFYGARIGGSTTRRSTYYAAILAWAGICFNYRSDGIGGYIVIK